MHKVNGSRITSKSSITMSPETSPDRIVKACLSSNSVSAKGFSHKSESPVSLGSDENGSNILKVEIHKPPAGMYNPPVSVSWRSMVEITPLTSTDVESCDTDSKDNKKPPPITSPVDDGKLGTSVKRTLESSDDETSTKKHCSSRARSELKTPWNDEEKGNWV